MKNVTKNAVLFLAVLGFCPLKVEITQFSDGFRLNFVVVMVLLVFSLPLQKDWHLMRNFRSVYAPPSLHVNFHFEILNANLRHVDSLIQAATTHVRFFSFSFFKSCAKFCLNSQKRKRAFLKGRIPHYCMSIIVNELKKIESSESSSGIEGPLLSSYVTRVLSRQCRKYGLVHVSRDRIA